MTAGPKLEQVEPGVWQATDLCLGFEVILNQDKTAVAIDFIVRPEGASETTIRIGMPALEAMKLHAVLWEIQRTHGLPKVPRSVLATRRR